MHHILLFGENTGTGGRTMAPRWWLLILCLAGNVLHGRAQLDSRGFINIDCGLQGEESYVDDETKLVYVSDAGFTDTGTPYNISAENYRPWRSRNVCSLRSFPDGVRNCYTLGSLESGLKYLFRATFLYGNYDGLNKRPASFDLYIGVNFWTAVNMSWWGLDEDNRATVEAIVVLPHDMVQVCLVNTGGGTPFISGLELRPLKMSLYPQATAELGLFLLRRRNFAAINGTIIRFPDDPYDRLWYPRSDATMWAETTTTERVDDFDGDEFEAPMAVLQTAIKPLNTSGSIKFGWEVAPELNNVSPGPGYLAVLHLVELELLGGDALRQFNISVNHDESWVPGYTPPGYLRRAYVYNKFTNPRDSSYIVTIKATANSTLPPIINAYELFSVITTTNIGTESQDASALMAIKAKYGVRKNWMGDPCFPKTMAWDGLTCGYAAANPPRITSINMSSSGLNSDIASSFVHLKALQYLDLSNNNLTGSIPDALSELPSLTVIDLSGNQLNGSIPSGLLKRIQDGSLVLRHGNNPNLCTDGNSCELAAKRKGKLAIYVAVPVLVIVVIVSLALLVLFFLRRRNQQQGSMKKRSTAVKPQNEEAMPTSYGGDDDSLRIVENRRFTYKELERITNGFDRVLGEGGFGRVYDGFLEDGTQVAVKLRSHSSNQGVKEFLAEAQILTRIHHKNLVSMIGYCKDREYMALVYEYMAQGTLREHIAASGRNGGCLPWRQRLKNALESAQGLEYLHTGCNPPLIHRDVKATNILLNARLEAKIADFGLTKAFDYHNNTHLFTNTLAFTPGYVDPEYQATMHPTTKSDVYSFGVVLLELVTGKPAILSDPEPTSIVQWARQRLARGNMEGMVDARMQGGYDINGVWKVAEIALKCTAQGSAQRPTMADVVAQLQECVELEEGCAPSFHTGGSGGDKNYNAYVSAQSTGVSSNTAFETELRIPTLATDPGPTAR
ncbi:unnamed protein product [Triticum turgidum subsp. durum]|uniref:non-specific serine/threonine protein kinase n=1 Tax=Triticum turgidum subsp. durum TaxID=4567 RepID=A0A9R0Q0T8_TRITD|nr:unnamed protein product [Triticum turgidum subsp. durum]